MLTELPSVGERLATRIERRARAQHQTLAKVLRLPPVLLQHEYGFPARAVESLTRARPVFEAHCREVIDRVHAVGARISDPARRTYPAGWRARLRLPPPLVYLYGNADLLGTPTLAILSSRAVSERNVTATVQVVQSAQRDGFTFACGGMKSTHRITAVTVRASGAARVVVLDRGLLAAFGGRGTRDPFGFGPGRCALDLQRTVVLSPFRPLDHAAPRNGRRRDELIAALADVVLVLSARPGGQMEHVCLQALDSGQCVLSWHGENDGLVAAGATPVDETHLREGLGRFLARV